MKQAIRKTLGSALVVSSVLGMGSVLAQTAQTVQYGYDAQGRLSTVTYPDNTTKTYLYENPAFPNAMTGELDENGQRFSSWTYDAQGRATNTVEANGAGNTTLVYNADGSVTVTDALGAVRTFNFSRVGDRNLTSGISGSQCPTCSEGKVTTYNDYGWVSSRTDYNNNVTTYLYDNARGLETSRTEAIGTPQSRTITTQWHATYRLPTQIDEPGKRTVFTYDASGNLLTKTLIDTTTFQTRMASYTYNNFGQVLTVDGPRTDVNDIITYTYYTCTTGYQCGQVQTITNALNQTTTFNTYNANGQPLTITDANGVVITLAYDVRQRLTSRIVGTELTSFEYWPTGLLKKVTMPDLSMITYAYDQAHRLTSITDTENNHIVYTLDAAGNRTAENVYDAGNGLVFTHTRSFDALSRLASDINASTATTNYGYDANGNPTSVDAPTARHTGSAYDALNRLTQVTDPLNGITQYGYDANDHLTSVTDPRNLTTSYQYNGLGDLTQQVSPDTGTTTHTYDSAGNLKTRTDARSNSTATYSYDALNRVTQVSDADQTVNYHYDLNPNGKGRLSDVVDSSGQTAWSYDLQGRVLSRTQVIGSVEKNTSYGYNSAGQLITAITPTNQAISYGYTNGKLTSLSVNGNLMLSQITYSPFGPIKGWTWANGQLISRSYDQDGQLTANTSAGISSYTYNPDGTIATRSDDSSANLNLSNGTTAFGVSTTSNQLNTASGALTYTYGYDAVGNMLSDGQRTFTYNAAGRMTTATKAGVTTTYSYNALGQRVKKSSTTQTTYFVYDEAGHLTGEYDQAGNLIQEIVWLGEIPVASIRANENGTGVGVFYIHTDHLNAPTKLTRSTDNAIVWRWDHDPFGNGITNEDPDGNGLFVTQSLRYAGQYEDQETGLYYNYFRYFDPKSGRYITSDPIGLQGGINTYAYVGGNPISGIDPLGLGPGDICGTCSPGDTNCLLYGGNLCFPGNDMKLFSKFALHGNWCGPGWTAGHEGTWDELSPGERKNAKPAEDKLDAACETHDKCYSECRKKSPCDKGARAACMKTCDRNLASGAAASGHKYSSLLWWHMRYGDPDPEDDAPQCNQSCKK